MKSSRGLSLIELMFSLFLSFIIFLYLLSIYMTAAKHNELMREYFNVEENAEIAEHYLKSSAKNAGYIGCAKLTEYFPIANHATILFSYKNKVTKKDDVITFRYANPIGSTLTKAMRGFSTLYTTKNVVFSPGDVLFISDCQSADIFIADKITNEEGMQKIISSDPLSKYYGVDAAVATLEVNQFFVQKTKRKSPRGDWVYALYIKNIKNRKKELVEGVSGMHFQFNTHDQSVAGISFSLNIQEDQQEKKWDFYVAL